ncbi:peptidoglycan-binding protein [Streptomyces sp. AC627_RSS907]|uniref:peptidoglycan-binding protein n=1 Tax=Streptomyces sp. AC627_RSS907 TaxID=2823684 RepID=UPI0027E53641|nr:peptidoglycan-binding protein [Streptomyces sp. AC627_RSS907]
MTGHGPVKPAGGPETADERGGGPDRAANHRKRLSVLVAVALLIGGGGWYAGTHVRSPAEMAASQRPPDAGPVTVPVERRPLAATVVATGSVEYAAPQKLMLSGAVGSGPSDTDETEGGEQRVTRAPQAGRTLKEGDVLMEVDGRPVFVLQGNVPMYRSMTPGTSGQDVVQLQRALRRLGFDPGTVSGVYRQGTAGAVSRWYRSKGYRAQEPGTADRQRLGELQQAVYSAQEALLLAQEEQTQADTRETETGDAGGVNGSPETTEVPDRVKELRLTAKREALKTANEALSAFQASFGTKISPGEVIFLPQLPVRLDKTALSAGDAASGEIGTTTSPDIVVQAVFPAADAALLTNGMPAQVTTAAGTASRGKVRGVTSAGAAGSAEETEGAAATGDGAATDGAATDDGTAGEPEGTDPSAPRTVEIELSDSRALTDEAGSSVRVSVQVDTSDGPVLAVPVVGVHTSAGGETHIRVERGERTVRVRVKVGVSAGDLVEVTPVGGNLEEGDRVVVGT